MTTEPELELIDWRRRVGELYAAVRDQDDPQRGHALWRDGRDELFRSHPQSPLPPGDPLRSSGVPYFPYDPRLRFDVPLLRGDRDVSLSVPSSEGTIPMTQLGRVHLPAPVDALIDVWWLQQYAAACSCRCATGPRASRVTAAAGTCSTPPRAPTWAGEPGG